MAEILDAEKLKDWNKYRDYMKVELKKLGPDEPVYITKKKFEFSMEGKKYMGYALLPGKKAKMSFMKCKQGGIQFETGTCTLEGKKIHLTGFPEDKISKLIKEADKTFKKLKLGWKIALPGGEGEDADEAEGAGTETGPATPGATAADQNALKQLKSSLSGRIKTVVDGGGSEARGILDLVKQASTMEKSGDVAGARAAFERIQPMLEADKQNLVQKAQKIEKAVQIWNKTEEIATKELRKLQKAIMDLDDPRGTAVIRGLEGILQKLDRVDDEAREAAEAAENGDPKAFNAARDDFMRKVRTILDYVSKDELIKDADSNPVVNIKIGETLTKSLNALMKAV